MGYWYNVHRRAIRDARKLAKIETRGAVAALFIGQAILAAVLFAFMGHLDTVPRLATAALPFLLFVPLYVGAFVTVPPALAAEQDAEIARLTKRADINVLAELIREGTQLRDAAKRIKDREAEEWATRVHDFLSEHVGAIEAARFETASDVTHGIRLAPSNESAEARRRRYHLEDWVAQLSQITSELH